MVGGYFLLDDTTLEQATDMARLCPLLEHGMTLEIRPVAPACHLARSLGWDSMRAPEPVSAEGATAWRRHTRRMVSAGQASATNRDPPARDSARVPGHPVPGDVLPPADPDGVAALHVIEESRQRHGPRRVAADAGVQADAHHAWMRLTLLP
jgi:hypothetical protein